MSNTFKTGHLKRSFKCNKDSLGVLKQKMMAARCADLTLDPQALKERTEGASAGPTVWLKSRSAAELDTRAHLVLPMKSLDLPMS